jgi:hypothetical protein
MAETNARLSWVDELTRNLEQAVPDDGQRASLAGVLSRALPPDPKPVRPQHRDDSARRVQAVGPLGLPADDLGRILRRIAGVVDRLPVRLEVVSPDAIASRKQVAAEDLLSGEFLGHFGGFLDKDFRENDFGLGWLCMQEWMEQALPTLTDRWQLPDELDLGPEIEAVRARALPAWSDADYPNELGRASLGSVGLFEKVRLAELGAHITHVLAAGLGRNR